MRADDFDALYAVASDPAIWALHPAHDRWQRPVFRAYFDQGMASGGSLVAIDPATRAIIGCSRYDLTRALPGEIEIGWTFLARAYWGGATNAVMKRLMLRHALAQVRQVIFLVGEHNLRSRRAMEKVGGRLTERVLDAPQGRHVIYAIDREAFARGPLMQAQHAPGHA